MTTLSNFYEQLCAIYKHECVNYNEKAFRTKGVQTSRYQSYKSLPNIHTIFIQLLATTRKDFFDKVNKLSIYPPSALNVMLWNIWTISNCCWWGCHSKKITNPNKILTISPQPLVLSWCFPFIGLQPELARAFEIKSFPGIPKYCLILEEKHIKILAQLWCSGF